MHRRTGYLKHYINTIAHKWWVAYGMIGISIKLIYRAIIHDYSKFLPSEAPGYADAFPNKLMVYGSPEYKAECERIKPTIDSHYKRNAHHPQHYPNGIDGMSLLDVIEMFCDWKAAIRKNKNGSMDKSLELNKDRFKISDQLDSIFRNSK